MKFKSKKEKERVEEAIKNDTFRIDYGYETVSEYSEEHKAYLYAYNFWSLGVDKSNGEKFIIRAVYRLKFQEYMIEIFRYAGVRFN